MTDHRIAIVVGGADCVLADIAAARELIGDRAHTTIVVNDMIADFPAYDVAATLHPDKLRMWLDRRTSKGLAWPAVIWAHRPANHLVTKTTPDWAGSSSLFACKIAIETGHDRIIVCGAPMTVTKHYLRGSFWTSAIGFRRGWTAHRGDIMDCVRSMCGWTAELLGKPTREWLEL
jgi:hypothetical protein